MVTVILSCAKCDGSGEGHFGCECADCFGSGVVEHELNATEDAGAESVFALRRCRTAEDTAIVAGWLAANGWTFWDLYASDRAAFVGMLPEGPCADVEWASLTADEGVISSNFLAAVA